ncbi:DUF2501 domain-containing protein [Massilia horti]|uniref:DUF2501 domain-containing protein n=1 Tax=Massilia horti TaxID=2562153 RepID=A0A4Y9T4J4_9BURK|nr:DUF2501 domain-containing protein [Massilia horti]TFW35355.1 DUF2501 domain-containing protein [Massilia horti]
MRAFGYRIAGLLLAVAIPATGVQAQVEGLLNKGAGSTSSLKGLAGELGGGSLTSGSMGNVAGLLQYCIGNNYLGGAEASSVKDQLVAKLPGGASSSDSGYTDGQKGLLHANNGKQFDLSGSDMTKQVTKQVCDKVLAQGKKLL